MCVPAHVSGCVCLCVMGELGHEFNRAGNIHLILSPGWGQGRTELLRERIMRSLNKRKQKIQSHQRRGLAIHSEKRRQSLLTAWMEGAPGLT